MPVEHLVMIEPLVPPEQPAPNSFQVMTARAAGNLDQEL